MNADKTILEKRLTDRKINITAMRLLVMRHLERQQSASSLRDIEKELAPVDRVTIFRTLKTFAENGLVHTIDDGSGAPKYAICSEECDASGHHDLHVHFYCKSCKETTCLPKSTIPAISLPAGFACDQLDLVAKGICKACSSSPNS